MDPAQLHFIQSWLLYYGYWLVFPLAIVEGPVLMTLCGFLLRLGFFSFWPLYFALMAGDLAADIGWYGVGYYWGRPFIGRFGKYVSITEKEVERVEGWFQRHPNKILFLSKITMGLGFALVTLIAAGMSRVPFRKYLVFNFFGEIIWTAFLVGIGYFFGELYLTVNKGIRDIGLAAFIIAIFFLLRGFGRYVKRRAEENKAL